MGAVANTQQLDRVLNSLFRQTVEYSWISKALWKVFFKDNKVYVASGYHVLEVSNFADGVIPNNECYDYANGNFCSDIAGYPLKIEEMQQALCIKKDGCFDTSTNLLLQYLNSFPEEVSKKSRFVIAAHDEEKDELIVSFKQDERGQKYVNFEGNNEIEFRVSPNSMTPSAHILIDTPYVCTVSATEGNTIYLNVLSKMNAIKMGLIFSPECFIMTTPEEMKRVHGMRNLTNDSLFTSFTPVNGYKPVPIHLDATMFIDIVKGFALTDDPILRIHTSSDPNHPIILESVGPESNLKVRATVATLNPFMGPQRR